MEPQAVIFLGFQSVYLCFTKKKKIFCSVQLQQEQNNPSDYEKLRY